MCQVDEDVDMKMEECLYDKRMKSCMKCDQAAVVIARVKDPFCKSCFLAYVTHRFKATIGKSRLIRDKEKVLIAFSGGQNSAAVARLVHEGRSESQHKKFRFVPSLVYIDDGVLLRQTAEARRETRTTLRKLMKAYDFPSFIVPLEEVVKLSPQIDAAKLNIMEDNDGDDAVVTVTEQLDELRIEERLSQRLLEIVDSASSLTAKEDLIVTLRHRLLVHLARQTGHTKVMLGDNGSRLAAQVLTGMAEGRGVTVPLQVGFADDREADCAFVRPLREFPSCEVSLYNHLSGVESICIPTITTKAGPYASINTLTADFINGLQVNFSSTVNTVLRTGEKLCTVTKSGEEADCIMCKAPLDTAVPLCSALESTQHSMQLMTASAAKERSNPTSAQCSSQQPCRTEGEGVGESSTGECCGKGDGSCLSSTKKEISFAEVSRWLCYGCRITLREMKDVSFLPNYVLEETGRRQRRSEMKEEIQDFLLAVEDR